jgi:hypothetical protein
MASRSKQKTTMAKLNRERAVQERRVRKQMRKDARKQAAAEDQQVVLHDAEADPARDPDSEPLGERAA